MPTPTVAPPSGFTIAEALVATALIGIAGACFVRTTVATTHARATAARVRAASSTIRARAAFAELARCSAVDTLGVEPGAGLVEHWNATATDGGVAWRDSVVVPGLAPIVASGVATCAE